VNTWRKWTPSALLVDVTWKIVWWFLKKLKIQLAYVLAILHQGKYPKELKVEFERGIRIPMFVTN
jgi:hypothetical protein